MNPQLQHIDFAMVGPDWLPKFERDFTFEDFLNPSETRPTCRGTFHSHRGLYHEVYNDLPPDPDLLIAFNAGISCTTHVMSWRETLHLIGCKKVPFLITGYNHKEVVDDASSMLEYEQMEMRLKIPATGNPFRGMRPFLDPSREGSDFYYSNASYAVLESK